MNETGARRLFTAIMLLVLVYNAPVWMKQSEQPSMYDAPWVYPSLSPHRVK